MERLVTVYKKNDRRFLVRQIVGRKGRHIQYKVKTCMTVNEVTIAIGLLLRGHPNWNKV
jgi:hypothetical protein